MMYYKTIGDRKVFSTCQSIQNNDGSWTCNPTAEQIAAAGWEVYVPPVVPPAPQDEPQMDEIVAAVKKMLSTGAEELSDEDALDVAAIYPTWASFVGKEVKKGQRLWWDGKLWKTTQYIQELLSNWTPVAAVSLFTEVSVAEIPDWTPRTAENAFMKGDKCKHVGFTWESDIDYNTWEPGTVGTEALWHKV